jgi:hypothetical protein
MNMHNNRRVAFSMWSMPRSYLEYKLTSSVEPSAWGHNWATLFLGDINMGNWPSQLGEKVLQKRMLYTYEYHVYRVQRNLMLIRISSLVYVKP